VKWEILENNIEIVDGEGVIGKKPVLKPVNSILTVQGVY
jgi:uncharacterized protein affecting Mg2+/Co2+ transport